MTIALFSGTNAQATGIDRYSRHLLDALRRHGVDAAHVALRRREVRIGPVRVGGLASLWWQRLHVRRAPEWELVHALDPAVATRDADVVTIHDLIPETHPHWGSRGMAARLDWALSRRNALRARHLIAISDATRAEILARWRVDPELVSVVHQGIDHERFQPAEGSSSWLASDKPNLVYVGDDHPRKNLRLAVQALAALRERHDIDARLVRIGPTRFPTETARHLAVARKRGLDVVEPGYLTDDELTVVYSQASCFVWPSYVEGFGFPPLEAMACGAPVVALDTPVNREIVGPSGGYHADDPVEMADAVSRAVSTPPSRKAAREHARQFTWDRTARGTVEAYARARAAR